MKPTRPALHAEPDAISPESNEQTHKLLDAGIWFYMRLLRAVLKSDKAVMAFLEDVGPDIITHYGRERLIGMSWGCDRPGRAELARIAKR
jgi:hypothetical protein